MTHILKLREMFLLENNKIMKQIREDLLKATEKYIGQPINNETIINIESEVKYILIEGKLKL